MNPKEKQQRETNQKEEKKNAISSLLTGLKLISLMVFTLATLSLLLIPQVRAHDPYFFNETITEEGNYWVSLITSPEPLEPGMIELQVFLDLNEVPLAGEQVNFFLSKGKKEYLDAVIVTDEEGRAKVRVKLESPGKYTLKVTRGNLQQEFLIHVHGRGVLVVGFLTSLAMLLAILLDRL